MARKKASAEDEPLPVSEDNFVLGQAINCRTVPKRKDQDTYIGWTAGALGGPQKVWIATKFGSYQRFQWVGIDPNKDYQYVGTFPREEASAAMLKAFEKYHGIKVELPALGGRK